MSDPNNEDAAFRKARRGRNYAIMLGLLAFVAIVFIVTIVHLKSNALAPGL